MLAFQPFRELQQCLNAKYWRRLLVCQKRLYSGVFNGVSPCPAVLATGDNGLLVIRAKNRTEPGNRIFRLHLICGPDAR
jgi:hypothetical protein